MCGICIPPRYGLGSQPCSLKASFLCNFERNQITIEAAYAKNGENQTIPMHSRLVEPLKTLLENRRG